MADVATQLLFDSERFAIDPEEVRRLQEKGVCLAVCEEWEPTSYCFESKPAHLKCTFFFWSLFFGCFGVLLNVLLAITYICGYTPSQTCIISVQNGTLAESTGVILFASFFTAFLINSCINCQRQYISLTARFEADGIDFDNLNFSEEDFDEQFRDEIPKATVCCIPYFCGYEKTRKRCPIKMLLPLMPCQRACCRGILSCLNSKREMEEISASSQNERGWIFWFMPAVCIAGVASYLNYAWIFGSWPSVGMNLLYTMLMIWGQDLVTSVVVYYFKVSCCQGSQK